MSPGRILVTYDSRYGATASTAETIANTLGQDGLDVNLGGVDEVAPSSYDVVIVGSPIRLGKCTPGVKRFLRKYRLELARKRVAFFLTCMSVTDDEAATAFPLLVDPAFDYPDRPPPRLSFMEKNHAASYYLRHLLKLAPGITPVAVAFFRGRLNTVGLSFLDRLIMRFAMFALPEIENGDFLNHQAISSWARGLSEAIGS